jgi:hypothetical protein
VTDITSKPPARAFKGYLKQLRPDQLTADQRNLLADCFPEFENRPGVREAYERFGLRWRVSGSGVVPVTWGRLRRYAGGTELPPGRYYTVCHNASGFDNGVLVNELLSYWSEATMVFPDMLDDLTLMPDKTIRKPLLVVRASGYEVELSCVKKIGEIEEEMPLSVTRQEINDVLDLRMPDAQAWFFDTFTSLEEKFGERGQGADGRVLVTFKVRRLRDFVDLLPTLLASRTGGHTFHQGIGAWLRTHGISALIYPSARSNTFLRHVSDRCGFSGWCLVDYRDAGPAEWEPLFGRMPSWARLDGGSPITVTRFNDQSSGFEVRGIEERERNRVRHARDRLLGLRSTQ